MKNNLTTGKTACVYSNISGCRNQGLFLCSRVTGEKRRDEK